MTAEAATWPLQPEPYDGATDRDIIPGETEPSDDELPAFVEPPLPVLQGERQPRVIFPEWMRSWDTLRHAIKWEIHYALKWVGFHAARLPLYFLRLLLLSPRGTGRLVGSWLRWLADAHGRALRENMGGVPDPGTVYRLIEQRRHMLANRLTLSAIVAAVGLSSIWSFITVTTGAGFVLISAAVAVVLGFLGRSPEHRITNSTGDSELPKLSMDLIVTALGALGISQLTAALKREAEGGGPAVRVRSPLGHSGPGFQVVLGMPPGVAAGMVVKKRDELAAGLGRPVSAVWPSADSDKAANELTLYVANQPLSKQKPIVWPLLKTGQTSVFAPIAVGTDPRGRPVSITLMFTNGLCGAFPRMGKTFGLRLIALAAALDPTCRLIIFDLKGGADWLPFEKVAYRFRVGDDEDDLDYLLETLRELKEDMRRRYKTLKGLPRDLVPEGKITPELAADRKLGLFPEFVVLDETQVIYADPTRGKEIEALVSDLTRRGPAAGIMLYWATQRVSSKTVPVSVSAQSIIRWAHKVPSHIESNLILGANASTMGINAATFSSSDKGVAYLVGEGEDAQVVRFHQVDGLQADAIITRARALRKRQGLLDGYCVEQDLEVDDDLITTPLQHLLDVWPGQDSRASYATLAERLREAHPDVYANWDVEQVGATLRAAGVPRVKVNRAGSIRQGVARADLVTAIDGTPDSEPDVERVEPTWPEGVADD